MAMKKLRVDELKPGMVFNKAVYIDMNNILVAPMVPLREEDIQRLVKWGIEEIETAGDVIRQVEPEKKLSIKEEVSKLTRLAETPQVTAQGEKSASEVFDKMLRLTEDVFEKVRNGAGYERDRILDSVSEMIEAVRGNKNGILDELTKDHEGRYLYTLGVGVAMLSAVIGLDIGYGKHRLIPLCAGALLHDIGMVRVPSYITDKKGKLTSEEYNRIKTHTIYGYRIATKELDLGEEVAVIVLQHHEAYDGSGYPRKLKEDSISAFAKIVSICDAFMAMTRKRSYRDEHLSYQAMRTILGGASRKFDPEIVKVFLKNLAIYPVGSIIQLSNSAVGRVISANPLFPLRPKVAVMIDEFGDRLEEEREVDLQEQSSLFIKKPLSKFILKQILNE
jgi:HD-GYP domain-containing protein (c-di-GMP phosphodiesterase class II)